MSAIQLIHKLGRLDLKLVGRDRFLLAMIGLVLYLTLVLRFGLPWLDAYLLDNDILPTAAFPYTLADLYPMLVGFMVLFQGSMIAGTIAGFMLIDEKDERTLTAILVTPVPFRHYVWYRVGVPSILAVVLVVGMMLIVNLAVPPMGQLLLLAVGAAFTGPLTTLFYGIAAGNKIQGFAMSKFVGVSGWIILGAWFVEAPWQWLFGVFPPFWICKAYWMALDGHALWWLALLAGIITQFGLLMLMVKRFTTVAYRHA
ncbi:MAG: hypothetical protein RhofKO_13710 [Rhodothermales bacterium]